MNRKQLLALRDDISFALEQREALGDFDANSKHMLFLLKGLLAMVDHQLYIQKPKKK